MGKAMFKVLGRGPWGRTVLRAMLWALTLAGLSGCMLISGEATTIDQQGRAGNLSTQFVSAEGSEERTFQASEVNGQLQVIAIVAVESGDLSIDLLDPSGSVVFSVAARPGAQITRSGLVPTDATGKLRYRVVTRGVRNGNYQLLFQP